MGRLEVLALTRGLRRAPRDRAQKRELVERDVITHVIEADPRERDGPLAGAGAGEQGGTAARRCPSRSNQAASNPIGRTAS
jgi:hypothetical protein